MVKTNEMKYEEILCAGFGGQGIMFMGKLLAQAGLESGKHVTWMPSYGAEVRGGTAYSMVRVSADEIATPVVTHPDILVAMNKPSLIKYEPKLKPGGILLMNISLIDKSPVRKDIRAVKIPMTEMAVKIGDGRCANMVAFGALIKSSKIVPLNAALKSLEEAFSGKDTLIKINTAALWQGYAKAK